MSLGSDFFVLDSDILVLCSDVSLLDSDVSVLDSDHSVLSNDFLLLGSDALVLYSDLLVLFSDVLLLCNDDLVLYNDISVLLCDFPALLCDFSVLLCDFQVLHYENYFFFIIEDLGDSPIFVAFNEKGMKKGAGRNGLYYKVKNQTRRGGSPRRGVEKSWKLQYNNTMKKIERVHDKMFTNVFGKVDNARALLKKVLPEKIKKRIDFSNIEIEDTDYVSKHFDEYYSDIVVKVKMNAKDGGKIPTDICFILEHKTKGRIKIFIQILKYMVEVKLCKH